MIQTNPRPTYYVLPARSKAFPQRITPHRFTIFERCEDEITAICTLSNRGDRLNNILKRGIPLDDARQLFYEMDG